MEPHQPSCGNIPHLVEQGMDKDQEEQNDGNAPGILKAGEEGGKEESAHDNTAQEDTAVVEEGKEEGSGIGGGQVGTEAPGPVDDKGNQEDCGPDCGDQEPEQQQEELILVCTQSGQPRAPMPPHRRLLQSIRNSRLTTAQQEELERVFQGNHYPNLQTRMELAVSMGVSETEIKDWFKIRRARFRRTNRIAMFYSALYAAQNPFL